MSKMMAFPVANTQYAGRAPLHFSFSPFHNNFGLHFLFKPAVYAPPCQPVASVLFLPARLRSRPPPQVEAATIRFAPCRARFVKVQAENPGTCPAWHAGKGQPCWIFVDEVDIR